MKLKEFIDKYADGISNVIETRLNPIYNPLKPEGVTPFEIKMNGLLRKPFPVQGEIIKALSKALYAHKREKLFVVGEMGTGKTMIALSVIYASPKPLRTLVVCPTHLVEKWKREASITIPNVQVIDLCVKNVISILQNLRSVKNKPNFHEIYVISKEKLKLSYAWRGAAIKRKTSKLPHCPKCGKTITDNKDNYITFSSLQSKRYSCNNCKEPLWQADPKLRRFAPAHFIKKYLKQYFDFCVLDEIQDYKAGESLQGRSMGALSSAVKKCLCLTGTLNGGYADDLFYLLYRTKPKILKSAGFKYSDNKKWLESYGTIETVQKIEEKDNYYGRGKRKSEIIRKRPGVSPAAIGKYLLDSAAFIKLADVIDGLPPYEESVVNIECEKLQMYQYTTLENKLKIAIKQYKSKAMAAMLQALLSYPDSCVAYPENIPIRDRNAEKVLTYITAPIITPENSLLPKELELINLVKKEKENNRKVLCYLTFTGSRDIRPRLEKILKTAGIKTATLDASVEPKKREAWVKNNTPNIDVLLVNAELVKTGLDLYEFPTIVFFQIGYNIFTLRQAARRSWRIGQTQPVKVFFFCYQDTLQSVALSLIAKKLEISLLVEGDLPEGLAEYGADDTSLINELVKSLVEGTTATNAEKAWANFRKKEIESQLCLSNTEIAFTETTKGKPAKQMPTKTSISENVTVKVSIIESKKKKQSIVEVKYTELDALNGKTIQFCMF